jgi:glycosyltransferase involved in cell wall biosynthesis
LTDAIIIELCNYLDYPPGGQLTFARQLVQVYGNRLALVGLTTDDTPVGQWVEKKVGSTLCRFLSVMRVNPGAGKPLVPARLKGYCAIKSCKRQILSLGVRSLLVGAPEALLAVRKWNWESVCFVFAGVENPVYHSRYLGARLFSRVYEKILFSAVGRADRVLACADDKSIRECESRSGGRIKPGTLVKFPTRVDTQVFKPMHKAEARAGLESVGPGPIIVNCGRINRYKGWNLILDAFRLFVRQCPQAEMIFVGDGEDRPLLEAYARSHSLDGQVRVTGFLPVADVVRYLNAADLCVVGSVKEGWSLAMMEALACGKPIVSTDVSGARDMIETGCNGFVLTTRDAEDFARAMHQALGLEGAQEDSLKIAAKYSVDHLARELGALWRPLA